MLSNETTPTDNFGSTLTIVGGKWTLRCAQGTPGAVERALTKGDNMGKIVHELQYTTLAGHIEGGGIVQGDFGKSAEIEIADRNTGDKYTLSIPLDSRYLFDFIKRMPNIDTSKEVSLELVQHKTKRTKAGKPVYSLHVVQEGKMVRDHYIEWKKDGSGKSVANLLNGLPEPVYDDIDGWDFTEQEKFLRRKFVEYFADYEIQHADIPSTNKKHEEQAVHDDTSAAAMDDYEDDVPF